MITIVANINQNFLEFASKLYNLFNYLLLFNFYFWMFYQSHA